MRTLLLTVIILFIVVCSISGAVPTEISYQGYLTDPENNPVTDGTHSVVFTIYDAPVSGTSVWTENRNITTVNGLFAVQLGFINPILDTVFRESTRYLGIAVAGDGEIMPRTALISVPYAQRVSTVDGASGGNITSEVSIGPEHVNTGRYSFVVGRGNESSGDYSTVSGGHRSIASANSSTIGGGYLNSATNNGATVSGGEENTANGIQSIVAGGAYSTASGDNSFVGGGYSNSASGQVSFVGCGGGNNATGEQSSIVGGSQNNCTGASAIIGGGSDNVVAGKYSAILGGYADTIEATADYSYLFGVGSRLSEDSTFMVDMPHTRFGDEATGYEFPTEDGSVGQVLSTNGAGQVSWVGMVPVGAVVAWMKNLPGIPSTLPDNFVECNGQVIFDSESPLNTNSVPDMNTQNRFLRGATTSGTQGGSETHNHILPKGGWAAVGSSFGEISTAGGSSHSADFNTDMSDSKPPFYDVVWVIRIK